MSISRAIARFKFFRGPNGQSAVGCTRRALHMEPLEGRRVMNADNPLAGGFAATDGSTFVATPTTGPSAGQPADAFQSQEELRQWLIGLADEQWGDLFGQPGHSWGWYGDAVWLNGDAMAFRALLGGAATTNDASQTNVQVAGVDEADLVETDGDYLYIVAGKDLVIVKAGVGDELQIASRVRIDGQITGMYLDGNRVAIISTEPQTGYAASDGIRLPVLTIGWVAEIGDAGAPGDSTQPHRPKTTVTVLDVTDRTSPALVQKTEFDGRLIASRAVDGQLRLVVANDFDLPRPNLKPAVEATRLEQPVAERAATTSLWAADYYYPRSEAYVYETRREYIDRVVDALLDAFPGFRVLSLDGDVVSEGGLATPESVYRPESREIGSLTTIATIDMHGSGKMVDTASVIAGRDATVYATESDIYLLAQSTPLWRTDDDLAGYQAPATTIWKFGVSAQTHRVRLAARGRVDGTILNQFAADEHDGYLRVVTTSGAWGAGQQLTVLQQLGKQLSVVGKIESIAPGENLYSVRFMGDRAFAVTFRQVDPLFALDLSDPTNPVLAGELKIPGYSDYLEPLDANHLIAIGRAADEATGFFQEMQISIFNIADLSDPQLIHRYSFDGGRSTASAATGDRWTIGDGDHHAVSYFAIEQILAIPIHSEASWSWDGNVETPMFEPGQGGLQVFHIDVAEGLQPTALIEHDSLISRAVRVGNHLYALSPGTVTVHALQNPSVQLGELAIGATADQAPSPLRMYVTQQTAQAMMLAVGELLGDNDEDELPTPAESFVPLPASAPAPDRKAGRAAAIARLAHARSFGDVFVPRFSPLAASVLVAVDQAFEDSAVEAAESAGAGLKSGNQSLASYIGEEFA